MVSVLNAELESRIIFGKNIERERLRQKLSRRQLGKIARVSILRITNMERAVTDSQLSGVISVCNALTVSVGEMLTKQKDVDYSKTATRSIEDLDIPLREYDILVDNHAYSIKAVKALLNKSSDISVESKNTIKKAIALLPCYNR